MKYKVCKKCGEQKSASNFGKSTKQPDGLTAWCKKCHTPTKEKVCKKCGVKKKRSEFWSSRKTKDKLTAWCRSCH